MQISFVNPVLPSRFENVTAFSNRNTEIKKIISIMSKRQNRSVLIWGEPGVGKSGLIDMLTWNITLQYDIGYSFWELDIDSQIKYSNYSQIKLSRKLAEFQNKHTKFNLIYPKFSKKMMQYSIKNITSFFHFKLNLNHFQQVALFLQLLYFPAF